MISVHETNRTSYVDEAQLRFATTDSRIVVTRNRDDFIALPKFFYATNETHEGILLVPWGLPNHQPERIAYALKRWRERYRTNDPGRGFIGFL